MYVERVPNRGSRPAVLLREGWREGGKVKKRTVANLSDWPEAKVEALSALLKGKPVVGDLQQAFEVVRSLPHGHVTAVMRALRGVGLERLLSPTRCAERDVCVAMIAARLLAPRSKLAMARGWSVATADSTLGELLELQQLDEDACYAAMDWLLTRQGRIETALAQRHLHEGQLVLYDVTSTYFEGRCCPLAKLGHSRDGKRDRPQIVVGLLTDARGCPVAVEVFEGNRADPMTLGAQLTKLRQRFALKRIVLVGDRGMITQARIDQELAGIEGLDWITCLRAPAIAQLVQGGSLQLSLFDQRDMAEITDPAFPKERLVVCKNPLLAEQRRRTRQELLQATEAQLQRIVAAVGRTQRPLRGQDRIGLRAGKVLGRFKMGKHFTLHIDNDAFRFERDEPAIAAEAALDGIYVVRTTVDAARLPAAEAVASYKRLANVERAFRSIKTAELHLRPIHHRKPERVRAHVLLCMLTYYVQWHMRRAWAPLLFDDDDPEGAAARRRSIVGPACRSERAHHKAARKRTDDGQPVHSFTSLLRDLATIAQNRIQPTGAVAAPFDIVTKPTPLQERALQLLSTNLLLP